MSGLIKLRCYKLNKGSVFDIPVIFVILLSLALTVIFSYVILTEFATALDNTNIPEIAKDQVDKIIGYIELFDMGIMVMFITLGITTLLLARDLPSHPAFFILSVLGMIIVMFFTWIIQEIYTGVIGSAALTPYAVAFPLTSQLMTNLPYVALGLFVMITLAIYTGGESRSVRLPV